MLRRFGWFSRTRPPSACEPAISDAPPHQHHAIDAFSLLGLLSPLYGKGTRASATMMIYSTIFRLSYFDFLLASQLARPRLMSPTRLYSPTAPPSIFGRYSKASRFQEAARSMLAQSHFIIMTIVCHD